ncbi:MAG: SUMF1/EgtB/PvdO family nonheme iron enzyme [Anaerolineales bacterium]|nr:SUMF1/EgtB/PvdO family nonheme iron enzyme [Anaerolineales bacterium]MCL4261475.1 SUMF1/EgtB/PvdO family nonheme iron enzyme [Anaerolineales bacterium]
MTNLIGQSLGRYHILEQLGEGGMATVYKAYDTRLETDVAVKVIRTENLTMATMERALKRFEREAKALARLTHPNIVKVTDFGEREDKPYLVMIYLPGGTLKQRLGKPIPWQEAAHLLLPIARALDFAHRQNMIHRDVKPSNILITADGEPMLTDFGIAKILDLEETADLTGTGMGIGTPEYMAPEQWTGKTSVFSDQYALGVVLYEMLTGRKPYSADTPAAILLKQATEPLPRPSQFTRDLPEKMEKLLLKVLARNPEDRYGSMAEFAKALESALSGQQPPASEQTPKRKVSAPRPKMEDKSRPGPVEAVKVHDTQATVDQQWKDSAPKKELAGLKLSRTDLPIVLLFVGGVILIGIIYLIGALVSNSNLNMPPTFTPTPGIGSFTESDGVTMMFVPAGEFSMGSDSGSDVEKPIHSVTLDAYFIDKYEVTNAAYKRCVDAGGCEPPKQSSSYTRTAYYSNPEFDEYPIIYVDWNMANAYCEWRGARLPTEAEWEKAARGLDERTYPWGNTFDGTKLNFCDKNCSFDWADKNVDDGYADTAPVGSYQDGVSPYGLFDMAGNVWEWVADWYDSDYYINSPASNPLGPSSGQSRVLRGGSWGFYVNDVRSAGRGWVTPDYFEFYIGFRCARGTSP